MRGFSDPPFLSYASRIFLAMQIEARLLAEQNEEDDQEDAEILNQ